MARRILTKMSIVVALLAVEAGADNVPVVLSVKPVLCITDRQHASCEMSLTIAWRSSSAGHYCLYNDLKTAPLACWARETSGHVEEARLVDRPLNYWLSQGETGVRVAEATVEVVTTDADDRRRNRQRRHAWSLL